MIYCVIPPELKDELYDRLVDRRSGPDRRQGKPSPEMKERRQTRDRRRGRIPGTFPPTDVSGE